MIVVGGGISGLMSALVLSKHGKSVLVLEKSEAVGGNCNSYMVDGFQVDTGPHAITHLQNGPLRRLMDEYFDYVPVFVNYGNYYVRTNKCLTKIPSNIKEFATFDVLPRRDRLRLAQSLTKALTLSAFGINTCKSVYDCLPHNLSQDSYELIDAIAHFLSGRSMRETSIQRILYGSSFVRDSVEEIFDSSSNKLPSLYTSLLAGSLSKNQLAGYISTLGRLATNRVEYAQAYPRGGLKAFLNSVLYSLPETVEIKTDSRVVQIITEDGRAVGVSTNNETFHGDNIVYSGFVKELPSLVDWLPGEYVENLKRIEQTRSLTVWLGLGERLEEFDYIGSEIWFKGNAYWAMPISNYDPRIVPRGKQLIGFTFVVKSRNIEAEKRRALETIFTAVPRIESCIEMEHYQVTIPEKAAVTIHGYIPDTRSPIKGLYLVGTDADNRSMGVTRAGYSVLELLKAMREDGCLGL